MTQIIIAVVVTLLVVVIIGLSYWYLTKPVDPTPELVAAIAPAIAPASTAPVLKYTTTTAGTPETASTPALPGTIVISNDAGQTMTQYGDETPVAPGDDEHFQPYMSVLANDIYRSDASFDVPLSKAEHEIYGNYLME